MDKKIYLHINNAEHCICCGEVIPEGRQVCPKCEYKIINHRDLDIDDDDEDWDDDIYND